jgi:TolA-binding protein
MSKEINLSSSPKDERFDQIRDLQKEIEELNRKKEELQSQLEERQELMQNLFSFVQSNQKAQ